jgi:hypothetical protein
MIMLEDAAGAEEAEIEIQDIADLVAAQSLSNHSNQPQADKQDKSP